LLNLNQRIVRLCAEFGRGCGLHAIADDTAEYLDDWCRNISALDDASDEDFQALAKRAFTAGEAAAQKAAGQWSSSVRKVHAESAVAEMSSALGTAICNPLVGSAT
jgi:hypothetical protein